MLCGLAPCAVADEFSTKGLLFPQVVTAFYEPRNFQTVWTVPESVEQLGKAIAEAPLHGLHPEDYHFSVLTQRTDVVLTDAFIAFAHDLRYGRASHRLKGDDWKITHNDLELIPVLERALSTGLVHQELTGLTPTIAAYGSLQRALVQYRQLAASGGWPAFQKPIDLTETENSEELDLLRTRLEITGDLEPDGDIVEAVVRFQRRHGLQADGIVGKQTIAALSVSAEQRVSQIELSLERMRWMSREFPERYVVVNVPGFELRMSEQGKWIEAMRVIVGKTTWCTPTFLSSEINQVVLNPYWYVPSIIASKEIYPLLKKDPQYLKRNNIRMIPRAQGGVQLRQNPGPRNSLGRIKFLFPNCCDCYLHDTREKQLFEKVLRLFSHGCIRIERAMDLGSWILEREGWSTEKLEAAIESNATQTIRLTSPMTIYIVYFTAWVDEDGSVQFRNDVYGKDNELLQSLATN